MIHKDDLLNRIQNIQGNINRDEFKEQLKNIFEGLGDISRGFLKIAHSANIIKQKKYYRELGYHTFDVFCQDVVGLTRKTVYLYLRIEEALKKYPEIFTGEYVTLLGSAKMDKIIAGLNKVEECSLNKNQKSNLISNMMNDIEHTLSVGEIEDIINHYTKSLN